MSKQAKEEIKRLGKQTIQFFDDYWLECETLAKNGCKDCIFNNTNEVYTKQLEHCNILKITNLFEDLKNDMDERTRMNP